MQDRMVAPSDQHRARAALSQAAAESRAMQPQVVAQDVQKR